MPNVAAVEPVTPERTVTVALPLSYPAASTVRNVDSAPVPFQAHPEQVVSRRLEGASVKDVIEPTRNLRGLRPVRVAVGTRGLPLPRSRRVVREGRRRTCQLATLLM